MRRLLGYAILTAVLTGGSITAQAQAVRALFCLIESDGIPESHVI